jgi:hypothetical protein
LLDLAVRIPPEAWMVVLCVERTKKAKWRTITTKKQVRMKYRVQENKKKNGVEGEEA